MNTESFSHARFLEAQEGSYVQALGELKSGRKRSHWIWYVFPQLRGLGVSPMSEQFGLSGLAEARAYLGHPVLGHRLRESTEAMLSQRFSSAQAVLGELDATKFRSCLTLFSLAEPGEHVFADALDRFFDGERDPATLRLLGMRQER